MNQVPAQACPQWKHGITLDSEETRRKGQEARGLRILPAGHPTQNWGVESLVWDREGAWEGLALSLPQDTAGRRPWRAGGGGREEASLVAFPASRAGTGRSHSSLHGRAGSSQPTGHTGADWKASALPLAQSVLEGGRGLVHSPPRPGSLPAEDRPASLGMEGAEGHRMQDGDGGAEAALRRWWDSLPDHAHPPWLS